MSGLSAQGKAEVIVGLCDTLADYREGAVRLLAKDPRLDRILGWWSGFDPRTAAVLTTAAKAADRRRLIAATRKKLSDKQLVVLGKLEQTSWQETWELDVSRALTSLKALRRKGIAERRNGEDGWRLTAWGAEVLRG